MSSSSSMVATQACNLSCGRVGRRACCAVASTVGAGEVQCAMTRVVRGPPKPRLLVATPGAGLGKQARVTHDALATFDKRVGACFYTRAPVCSTLTHVGTYYHVRSCKHGRPCLVKCKWLLGGASHPDLAAACTQRGRRSHSRPAKNEGANQRSHKAAPTPSEVRTENSRNFCNALGAPVLRWLSSVSCTFNRVKFEPAAAPTRVALVQSRLLSTSA